MIKPNQAQKIDAHIEIFCKDCINTLNIEKCDTCESGSNNDSGDEIQDMGENQGCSDCYHTDSCILSGPCSECKYGYGEDDANSYFEGK